MTVPPWEVLPASPADQEGNHVLGCMPSTFHACTFTTCANVFLDSMHGDCKATVPAIEVSAPDVAMHAASPTPAQCALGMKGLTCMPE